MTIAKNADSLRDENPPESVLNELYRSLNMFILYPFGYTFVDSQ